MSAKVRQYVVRCPDYELECRSREVAERHAERLNTETYCHHTDHVVVEQVRGPETNWLWKDVEPC